MAKINAKGFFCYIDESVFNEWVRLIGLTETSKSKAVEYWMNSFNQSTNDKTVNTFSKKVEKYFINK